jgi:hypothetical protein
MGMVRQVVLTGWACSLVLNASADARGADSYSSIIDRNPFGLKDPPPAVTKPEAPHTNDPKKEEFYLTGISTIGNPKKPKAYLLAKDTSKKDYDQRFFNLSVGDRQGDLELKEIDEKGRRVRVIYQGEEKWLSMKDNGVPAPAGPAPGHGIIMPGVPGVPGQPGAVPAPPGAVPVPLPNPNNGNTYAAPQPQPLTSPSTTPNGANPAYARRIPRTTFTNPNAPSLGPGTTIAPPALPPIPQ